MQGTAADTGEDAYQIKNSLRFDDNLASNGDYIFQNFPTQGDRRTWTFAGWFKFTDTTTANVKIFSCKSESGEPRNYLIRNSNGQLELGGADGDSGGSYFGQKIAAKLRDPSAWYHICVNIDSRAVEKERTRIWINGKKQTLIDSTEKLAQNQAPQFNNAKPHNIGADGGANFFGMYAADVYFIDGLALYPSSFGAFNSFGIWDPKKFTLPKINTGKDWQSMIDGTEGSASFPIERVFDGNTQKALISAPGSQDYFTFTPTGELEYSQSVEFFQDGGSDNQHVSINGWKGKNGVETTTGEWIPIVEGKGTLTTLDIGKVGSNAAGDDIWIGGIRVDGVILTQNKTDPTTRTNPNYGITWSSGTTSGVNADADKLFDGSLATVIDDSGGADAEWSLTLPSAISGTTLVEMCPGGGASVQPNGAKFKCVIDGTTHTYTVADSSHPEWVTVYNGAAGSLTKVMGQRTASNTGAACKAVRVNGHVLQDSVVDNSYYLKFDASTRDSELCKDNFGGSLSGATGGLPIYNTNGTGETKTSGYRADSSAGTTDGTGLVLAVPGDTVADVHHNINTGSSEVSLTTVGSGGSNTINSRFYGSALELDGNSYVRFQSSDIEFGTGDFTIEFWFYSTSRDNMSEGLFTTSSSSSLYQGSINNYTEVRWSGAPDNTREIRCWFQGTGITSSVQLGADQWIHYAMVRNSGTLKHYINGVEKGSVALNADITGYPYGFIGGYYQQDKSFTGSIQDFRIYKGAAKYTSGFKPPSRRDWSAYGQTVLYPEHNTDEITNVAAATTTLDYGISFVSGSDESLTRVWGSGETNNKKWTFATWFKTTNGEDYFLNTGAGTGGNHSVMRFESANVFQIYNYEFSAVYGAFGIKWDISNISLNDGNWHHLLVQVNTSSSNSKKRIKIFFDGVQRGEDEEAGGVISGEFTPPGQNSSCGYWNNNHTHKLGDQTYENKTSNMKFAETYFVDGNSSSFGVDTFLQADGRPQPTGTPHTSISGSYGNKGFYLKYDDSGALGDDESGNTNDWSLDGSPDQLTSGTPSKTVHTLTFNSIDNAWNRITVGSSYSQSDGNAAGVAKIKNTGSKSIIFDTTSGTWSANTDKTVKVPANDTGDDFVDSPTNYEPTTGYDYQGGVTRGNYCTMHPLTNQDFGYGKFYLKEGNLLVGTTNGSDTRLGATIGASSGKWYWEMEFIGPAGSGGIGINKEPNDYHATWNGTGDAVIYQTSGDKHINGTGSAYGASYAYNVGNVIGVQWDADNGQIWFWEQGVLQNSGTAARTGMSGVYTPVVVCTSSGNPVAYRMNFGQRPFKYQNAGTNRPSADYKCLCSTNLPDTFSGDEINDPSKYFDVRTRMGSSDNTSIGLSGLNFQPDLVWDKSLTSSSHTLIDAIRGATKYLSSNSNAAEATNADYFSAFTSDGFTTGDQDHGNTTNVVSWCWDAGTAASGANDDGSIDIASGDQWKNATAGFSITKYTGTGSSATVGHGLGAKPKFIIVKRTDSAADWAVQHTSLSADKVIWLNKADDAETDSGSHWLDAEPTNTVFTIKDHAEVNASSGTYIAYCWTDIPGYSSFGAYTGNNNADGPFVYTGFRVKYLLQKRRDDSGNWQLMDIVRDDYYNPLTRRLKAEGSDAEFDGVSTNTQFDAYSNGFKIRDTDSGINANGGLFIYAAFAEHPFKTARAF